MSKPEVAVSISSLLLMISPGLDGYTDGELSKDMNTRVQSEPRYDLRKRNPPQVQQNTLLLPHEFEKLTIH